MLELLKYDDISNSMLKPNPAMELVYTSTDSGSESLQNDFTTTADSYTTPYREEISTVQSEGYHLVEPNNSWDGTFVRSAGILLNLDEQQIDQNIASNSMHRSLNF